MAHNYVIQVTAGPSYDVSTHKVVAVNTATPLAIESEHISAKLNVRIQNYRGLPLSSPSTSPYFTLPPHDHNADQYSIAFAFTPKTSSFAGDSLVFGNDLDHPVRDRLPPGLNTAFKIAKWFVDPGLQADFYADRPWLVSGLGGGINTLYVRAGDEEEEGDGHEKRNAAKKNDDDNDDSKDAESSSGTFNTNHESGLHVKEGGNAAGMRLRREHGVPDGEAARKKHFLNEANRKAWTWEKGVEYACDFFNPYLDFSEFALRLPGFTLHMMSYWDGQPLRDEDASSRSHAFRYVLKDQSTDTALLVIVFTLYLKDDIDSEGKVKAGVKPGLPFKDMEDGERERHEKAMHAVPEGKAREEGSSEEDDDVEDGETKEEEMKEKMKDGGSNVPGGWDDDDGVD